MAAVASLHPAALASVHQWTVVLTRTADKAQRKLDKPLRTIIRDALMKLAEEPLRLGERLSQPFSQVYSHHIKYQGREYRVAYQLNLETQSLVILLIGPHENFYRTLRNLVLGS